MNSKTNINNFLENFFYLISKIIFFFPIVFLFFGLLIKFNRTGEEKLLNVALTPTLKKKNSDQLKIDFDLKGPLMCLFPANNASVSAYIKDKKIKIILEKKGNNSYFLVNNDCLYQWQEDKFTGTKNCGINHYLNLMASFFDNNQALFFSLFLKNKEIDNAVENKDFSLDKICKKVDFDNQIFLVPTTILFKNVE